MYQTFPMEIWGFVTLIAVTLIGISVLSFAAFVSRK